MDTTTAPHRLQAALTPWYYRRMAILFGMFFFFGAYFGYDWRVGYPKKKAAGEAAMARYQELWPQGEKGQAEWAKLSRDNKWETEGVDMKPKVLTDAKIAEQFYGMLVCLSVAAVVAVFFLRSRGTVMAVDDEALELPGGTLVPFTAIRKVDTRKWLNKGLAVIWFEAGGPLKRGVIDGLKYGGFKGEKPYLPDQILERVVERFQGELVELQEEEEAAGEETGEPADAGTAGPPR
jgi:hypothetical protein